MQRLFDLDITGYVQNCPTSPECGMPGGKPIGIGRHCPSHQVGFEYVAVTLNKLAEASKQDPLTGQFFIQFWLRTVRVDMGNEARKFGSVG